MRTPTDALRSVARYTALSLGTSWEVRMSGEKGTFQRPYARVFQVPSLQIVTQRWDTSKLIASYRIAAYPAQGASADASQLAALDVMDKLWAAFGGPGTPGATIRTPADSHRGRPYRVPLYDYAGVPLDGPSAFVDETKRDPRDFLHVEGSPELTTDQDPDSELLYVVAANIRMSWVRSAAVPSGQPTAQSVLPVGAETNG